MGDQPNLPEGRDVEDVLSSIRRLVSSETETRLSESHRAFARRSAQKLSESDAIRPTGEGKPLLLSSALRVEAPVAEPDPEASGNGSADAPSGEAAPTQTPAAEAQSDTAQTNGQTDLLRLVPADRVAPVPIGKMATAPKDPSRSDDDLADVALRELVRSVLREELEGEIGDRISRNLTQFVRKEIAKALNGLPKA